MNSMVNGRISMKYHGNSGTIVLHVFSNFHMFTFNDGDVVYVRFREVEVLAMMVCWEGKTEKKPAKFVSFHTISKI